MRIVYPETIILDSSNIEIDSDGYSEWSSGTTYALNAMVMVTSSTPHKIYKSLANSNTNNPPATTPLKWQDQGGTNRWKMFDEFIDTQSENSDLLQVTVNASNCDRFALFNLDATEVEITLIDSDTSAPSDALLISSSDQLLVSADDYLCINRSSVMSNLYNLSNGDGTYKTDLVGSVFIYNNALLQIDIRNPGGTAKCGIAIVGIGEEIGTTLYGVKPGIIDYSIKEVDEYGSAYLSQGTWAREVDLDIKLDLEDADLVYDSLNAARGELVVIEANGSETDWESLNLYGFFRDWQIKIDHPTVAFCSINFQGVI